MAIAGLGLGIILGIHHSLFMMISAATKKTSENRWLGEYQNIYREKALIFARKNPNYSKRISAISSGNLTDQWFLIFIRTPHTNSCISTLYP